MKITVEEILDAAAIAKYTNYNEGYIGYKDPITLDGPLEYWELADRRETDGKKLKVMTACVIGEAFLNLGLAENGYQAIDFADALSIIEPDDGMIRDGSYADGVLNLRDYINYMNDSKLGKKRIIKRCKKLFSNSLNKVVEVG